jgi:alkylhydroperoxidase family enzyme
MDRPRKAPTCGGSRRTDRCSIPHISPSSASHAARDLNSYDAEVIEAVAVIALFRGVNAWTDLLAIPVDDV